MSPNVGNFVHDLVEMAKAMETLPQVQAELAASNERIDKLLEGINRRDADLEQSRTYAATLEQKVHDLEVSRDDAELRFLELDEKAGKASNSLHAALAMVEGAISDLTPPKPEPQPEPVVEPQTRPLESSSTETQAKEVGLEHGSSIPEAVHSISELPGQSESSPTVDANTDTASTNQTLPSTNVQNKVAEVEAVHTSSPNGPYHGKRYHDMPGYIPLDNWLNGGGNEADYYWRPAPSSFGA